MGGHRLVRANAGSQGWGRRVLGGRAGLVGVGLAVVGTAVVGVGIASGTTSATPSVYSSVTPVTVLGKSLAADSNTDVAVAGVGSVPSNATSVQLSVTALSGTTTSSMYVYPTGATKPTSANVRWTTGEVVTIPVTVAVGTGGKVRLTTDGGTVTVKVAVVGYFSPAPASGSTGYVATTSNVPLGALLDPTTVVSLSVPAGTYTVLAKATMNTSDSSDEVSCDLMNPSGDNIDQTNLDLDTSISQGPLSMAAIDTTAGGAMSLYCYDFDSHANAYNVQLIAIQLKSATGNVANG
jgi:hypothetical protein